MASKNQTGTLAYIYRVFRMAVLLLLIGVIGLVLRKSPPPVVNTAADAAATLQANLEEEKKSADAEAVGAWAQPRLVPRSKRARRSCSTTPLMGCRLVAA